MRGSFLSVIASSVGGVVLPPSGVTTQTSVTENNITWNFATGRSVGQYVDGTYFTVIPSASDVEVTSATPVSAVMSGTFAGGGAYTDEVLHGMMLDPAQGTTGTEAAVQAFHSFERGDYAGFASTLQPYDASLNIDPGIAGTLAVTTPTTAVKTITDTTPPDNGRDDIMTDMSMLTFVAAAPSEESFRPSPRGADKVSYFTAGDLDLTSLLNLAAPATMPTYATLLARITKPYMTFYTNNLFARNVTPANHQESYGRDIANNLADVLLAINTDGLTTAEKTALSTQLVQIGLDIINAGIDGATWGSPTGSFGGGQHWVKATAIFAAHALRNASNSSKAAELLARVDPDQFIFTSEDRVFTYVRRTEIETFPDQRVGFDHIDFKDYMENAPMWNSKPSSPALGGAAFDHVYREIVWSSSVGQLLALRMMGIEGSFTPAARDYLDFIYDWGENETLSGAPNTFTGFAGDMLSAHLGTYSSNYSDGGTPAVVRVMARDEYVWIEYDKLLSKGSVPASSAFAVTVAGSAATVVSAADDFTDIDAGFTFQSPDVYGSSLAVRLSTAVAEGEAVTIAYTAPGSNAATTLGGAAVPSIAATTATNQTGLLPEAVTTIDTVSGEGTSDADRQYSGTNSLPPETIDWLQLSVRFQIGSFSQDDTFISSSATSTARFWLYMSGAAATNMRFYFGGAGSNRVDLAGAGSTLPVDTDITMHVFIDYSQTDEVNAVKIYFDWDGGSWEPTIASSARTADTHDIKDLFTSGVFIGGTSDTTGRADVAHTGYILNYGQGSTPTAPTWTDTQFAEDADWGGNGENVWGEPRYYWAGSLEEWNGSLINRGNNGALPLTPRLFDEASEDLITPYEALA